MIDDKPLYDTKYDRLGFGNIAHHLASAFLQNDLSRGFVVGVEGAWGSGKSSLVNLALEELSKKEGGPCVIRFAPWLVGSRNELLAQLFSDLEPVILQAIPESERNDTKKILGRYAQASSGLAALAGLAEMGGVPWAGPIGKFLKKSGEKAAELSENSLGDLNQSLREKLELLDRPIVVFVDDLDRLEPSEVAEVLRLVKAVADFPNVAYILAYDLEVIADSLQRALGISNGRSYLEKVVQASFKVPNAMNFDLRNWLKAEVSMLLDLATLDPVARNRLEGVYHQWSNEFLETPRDVVRVINSLKLNFSPVRDHVDPGDMVFLQIIRTKDSKLFNWIERYVSSLSAIGDWGFISPGAHERVGKELLRIVNKEGEELNRFIHRLEDHLPGMDLVSLIKKDIDFKVLSISGVEELKAFSAEKRLASPSHYSYYFSFAEPSGSLNDSELEAFLFTCEQDPEKAASRFRQLIETQRPQGGRLAEVLLDRLVAAGTKISPEQVKGLFKALGEAIDELVPFAKTDFGPPEFLKGNRQEVFGLIEQVQNSDERSEVLRSLFSDGKSVAWLVGIIRESTFEHGAHGDRIEPEEARLLSVTDFDLVKGIFLRRMIETPPTDLLKVPQFLSLIFAWHQVGDQEGAVNWVSQQAESDQGFLDVLERMKSKSVSSSEGVQWKLRPETLNTFFGGYSSVQDRLEQIATRGKADLKIRAKELLTKFDDGP